MEFLIASRRGRPGDDPIFTLNAEAKARKAAGEDVVNATIGALLDDDGKLMVMQAVVDALQSVKPEVTAGYAPIAGRADYRQAVITDLLGAHGLAEQSVAVATPGGSGALRMAIDDFLDVGQTLLTSSFFWGPYRTLSDEAGRKIDTFNMFDESGRFDTADFDRKLGEIMDAQGRALIFLNTPCHNPTGYSLDKDEWAQTAAILAKHADKGAVVALIDAAYSYYAEEGLSVAVEALKPVMDKVLTLFAWSASKSFAQYGLRVGALIATTPDDKQRALIENALTFSCRGLWSNCNAGGQFAIARVLTEPDLVKRVTDDRKALVNMLARRVSCWNELAGAKNIPYPRYQGGFFTTVFCKDSKSVAAALREKRVYLVPMPGVLRVAMCAVSEPHIERVVAGLAETL
jgi:aromatic-amino-acid transaminase